MSAAQNDKKRLYLTAQPTPRLWLVSKAEQVPWTGGSVGHDAPHVPLGHIGTTSTGHGIIGPSKEHVQAAAAIHGPERAMGAGGVKQAMGSLKQHAANHVSTMHPSFGPKEHKEAAAFHTKLANSNAGTPRGIAHSGIAQAHTEAAGGMSPGIGKSLWLTVTPPKRLYMRTR